MSGDDINYIYDYRIYRYIWIYSFQDKDVLVVPQRQMMFEKVQIAKT